MFISNNVYIAHSDSELLSMTIDALPVLPALPVLTSFRADSVEPSGIIREFFRNANQ